MTVVAVVARESLFVRFRFPFQTKFPTRKSFGIVVVVLVGVGVVGFGFGAKTFLPQNFDKNKVLKPKVFSQRWSDNDIRCLTMRLLSNLTFALVKLSAKCGSELLAR